MKIENKHLAVTAAVLLVITLFLYSGIEFTGDGFAPGATLVQGLDTSEINRIVIDDGDSTVTIVRSGELFVVEEASGYPADMETVNQVIVTISDIRLSRLVSANQEYYSEYGVAEDSPNTSIAFYDGEDKLLIGVIKGKRGDAESGPYVRMMQGEKVYAATSNFPLKAEPLYYIETAPFEYDVDKIVSITAAYADGSFTINRQPPAEGEGSGELQLVDVPEGESADESSIDDLAMALNDMIVESVHKPSEISAVWNHSLKVTFRSGLQYVVNSAEKDGEYLVALAAVSPEQRDVYLSPDETETELREKEDYFLDQERATAFNTLHAGFVYKVDESDGTRIRAKLADLLKNDQE